MIRKFLTFLFIVFIFYVSFTYNKEIVDYLVNTFSDFSKKATVIKNNKYASNNNYSYIELTDNFSPSDRQDILNIYYTVLNSGMTDFSFYCPKEYDNCLNDIDYISNDQTILSNINNFVPVYNSFQNIETKFDNLGKVDIHIIHTYSEQDIIELEKKVKEIVDDIITDNMDDKQKIKVIHDYIINNTKYDDSRSDQKIVKYKSDTAYGALIEHYAICGGYSDSMKLFLDYLNIPNYKISSENHIWNFLKLNDEWLHIDLTWDDPKATSGKDILDYTYFLITTKELEDINTGQHIYDKTIYPEAK